MVDLAVDCSNYSGRLSAQNLSDWSGLGVKLVIVQGITSQQAAGGVSYTRQQLQACLDAGMPVDLYVYLYGGQDLRPRLATADGITVHRKWLDAEEPLNMAQINAAWPTMDSYPAHIAEAGLYSAKWWWDTYMPGKTYWSNRKLWAAQYDGIAFASVFTPFGGWNKCFLKQYRGSSVLAGVSGIDISVLSAEASLELMGEQTEVSITVGQGMADRMQAMGDHPIYGFEEGDTTDQDGTSYHWEKCYGTRGLYISSNASGAWENVGPL